MRAGIGYDIHALAEGRELILGGVKIPHTKGLQGHSDADVLSHAVTDAILGAVALGDIGMLFPDSDPKWKDANSLELLKIAAQKISEKGFMINNIDSVIICEKPKLKNYLPEMITNLSRTLKLNSDQVSVKATTHEQLGSIGREEGIAAQSICFLSKKS